jgi:UDP-N-acetylglucosamine 2-epimerase
VRILAEAAILLENSGEYTQRARLQNPYGDGHAAIRIRDILEQSLA